MSEIKILFITHPYPNYVPDLLLHGLRKLFGPNVVDFPKKESLYAGVFMGVTPEDQICQNWFPPDNNQIDRQDIPIKIAKGYFQYIICDVRAIPFLQNSLSEWPSGLVFVDGEDFPVKISPGPYVICRRETDGTDFSIPLPMALPEEIFNWIKSFDDVPKNYSVGFLGSVGNFYSERKAIIETIAKFYPDSLLKATAIPSEENPNPTGRLGRNDYYSTIQKCKVVLTLRGAGYDTFRFWENAACNAVHVSQKMPLFIPNDFVNWQQIIRFDNLEELRIQIDKVLEGNIDANKIINEGRNQLSNFHLTTKRAIYLIDRLNRILE